jgi:hypothetical protein
MNKFIIAILIIFVCSCSTTKNLYFQESEFRAQPEPNMWEVTSTAEGKSDLIARDKAESKPFEILFFSGYENSPNPKPMIGNEKEARKKYSSYINKFFAARRYKQFLWENKEIAKVKTETGFKYDLKLLINRKKLENDMWLYKVYPIN